MKNSFWWNLWKMKIFNFSKIFKNLVVRDFFFISRGQQLHDLIHHKISYISDHSASRYYWMNYQPNNGKNSSDIILELFDQKSLKFFMILYNIIIFPVIAKKKLKWSFFENFQKNFKIFKNFSKNKNFSILLLSHECLCYN